MFILSGIIINFPTADLCGCSGKKSGPASAQLKQLLQAMDGAVHVQCRHEARPMENMEKRGGRPKSTLVVTSELC